MSVDQMMTRGADAEGSKPGARLGYLSGIRTVVELELKQRLRSRSWYIMLAVWFVVVLGVTALASSTVLGFSNEYTERPGQLMYELVIGFVLLFGLLVAPALSANTITGDRAGGTLAVLQNTLLTPGQILWGKWFAAWVASLGFLLVTLPMLAWAVSFGDVNVGALWVLPLVCAVELGVACGLGVGISARSTRPLFAVVGAYLTVALLGLGTLIGFGLSVQMTKETVMDYQIINPKDPWSQIQHDDQGNPLGEDGEPIPEEELDAFYRDLEKESADFVYDPADEICTDIRYEKEIFHTERTAWMLAAHPFAILADTMPTARDEDQNVSEPGPLSAIQFGVRMAQVGADATGVDCVDGVRQPRAEESYELARAGGLPPMWPLGLGVQLALVALLIADGRRRLVTPAAKLASGTRVA